MCSTEIIEAQRHYAGVTALESSYGLNAFGRRNTNLNFSISKYRNRTSYWKGGISFLEKSYIFRDPQDLIRPNFVYCSTGQNYYADMAYYVTLATNRTSVYVNSGAGIFAGVEMYSNPAEQTQFIFGPKLAVEIELFIAPRIALLCGLHQYWNPFSDLRVWNTTWSSGVKVLIYR
ncbi:MAG: conjugal transfer protein TraO [Dysgonamonadaceae bacterium]|jgi:hypothetical protein|nr:conjugal transfer protein TraO [Dysgonamonadaceae bacterium]